VPFHSTIDGTWDELDLGACSRLNRTIALRVNASYRQRFNGRGKAWAGKAGPTVSW
jgi:hypothetical protein